MQERSPALRRWARSPSHIFRHRRLGDVDAQLEQFAMDTRRAPKRVLARDAAYQRADVRLNWRAAETSARFPSPEGPNPRSVPADQRLRSEDDGAAPQGGEQSVQQQEYEFIDGPQTDPLGCGALKYDQLLAQEQYLGLTGCPRAEQ